MLIAYMRTGIVLVFTALAYTCCTCIVQIRGGFMILANTQTNTFTKLVLDWSVTLWDCYQKVSQAPTFIQAFRKYLNSFQLQLCKFIVRCKRYP